MPTPALQTECLKRCPVCGGIPRYLLDVLDFESGTGTYGIDTCTACGIAFTNPRPLECELWKLYATRETTDFAPRPSRISTWLRTALIRHRLSSAFHPFPGQTIKLLDYGCGDGSLVAGAAALARGKQFQIDALGVDFHPDAPPALVAKPPGTGYLDVVTWEAIDDLYDQIFVRHVLEHHSDPPRLLRMLAERLRPGGCLHIEVPNRQSVWAMVFGQHFFPYYVPRHLFHFDADSLRYVIEESGLRMASLDQGHTPAIGKSLACRFSLNIDNLGLVGLAIYPLQVVVDMLAGRSTTLRAKACRD